MPELVVHCWYTAVVVLTAIAGCGSRPSSVTSAPAEPAAAPPAPRTHAREAPGAADADRDEASPAVPLACAGDTRATRAPAPDPTWVCVRADGTRHGAFVTLFPDGSIELTGAYRDGKLDGPWVRRHPGGGVAEEGHYLAGHKHGRWRQTSTRGVVLGEYELVSGTGVERRWYDEGALYSERSLVRSVPHGPSRSFAPDGTVISSTHHVEGKLDGGHVFGTRGTMRFEETFARGVRRGPRRIWLGGTLIAEEQYDRRGQLDGPYALWRRPRVPRVKGQFAHGRRTGAWTWFDRANNKERAGAFIDDQRDGAWMEWLDGSQFLGSYQRGKPHGAFVQLDRRGRELGRFTIERGTGTLLTFHDNRKPASRKALRDGLATGLYQELTTRGTVVVEGRYRRDLKHGRWREWTSGRVPRLDQSWRRGRLHGEVTKYVDGKLAMRATYADGKAEGPYAEYRDGAPAVTGQFVDDRKHGTWTSHGEDGAVVLIATYERGVLHGPWRQRIDGAVLEGTMARGRRAGTWTRTEGSGRVSQITYPAP